MGSPTSLILGRNPSSCSIRTRNERGCLVNLHLGDGDYLVDEYVNALEEERQKEEVFKRELPLCLQLLHDAIQAFKEKLAFRGIEDAIDDVNCTGSNVHEGSRKEEETVLVDEGFLQPWKWVQQQQQHGVFSERTAGKTKKNKKRSWDEACGEKEGNYYRSEEEDVHCRRRQWNSRSVFPSNCCRIISSGGAFVPFNKHRQLPAAVSQPDVQKSSGVPLQQQEKNINTEGSNCNNVIAYARKARRSWSAQLHNRFVHVLDMLGGPHVATPKLIRELMKVEGLTNDEVKNHLQKYRAHARIGCRSPTLTPRAPAATAAHNRALRAASTARYGLHHDLAHSITRYVPSSLLGSSPHHAANHN